MARGHRQEPSARPRQQSAHEDRPRSPAEQIAAEVFVKLMKSNRVRYYTIATQCWTRSITRHALEGPKQEIVRYFELAQPFWPLTIHQIQAVMTGYGISRGGTCIRYTRNPYPSNRHPDDVTVERVQFGPGCQELMRRASDNNPVFICERLAHLHAVKVVREYLIDAIISLSEGRGPLVIPGHGA
jgi:hypothetical protein